MRAIIYNEKITDIAPENDVMAIKLSYLVANTICVSGELAGSITYNKVVKSLTLHQKLAVIASIARLYEDIASPDDEEIVTFDLYKFCEEVRLLDKKKHTNRDAFLEFKKIEKAFLNMFLNLTASDLKTLSAQGYLDLASLVDYKILNTDLAEISIIAGSWIKTTNEQLADRLLNLLCGNSKEEEPRLLFLQEGVLKNKNNEDYQFVTERARKQIDEKTKPSSSTEVEPVEDKVDEDNPTFLRLLKIPYLGNVSASELKAIRSQLKEPIAALNKVLNSFITEVIASTENSVPEKMLYTECMQASYQMKQALAENQLLKSVAKANNSNVYIEIMLSYRLTSFIILLLYERDMITRDIASIMYEKVTNPATAHLYPKFLAFMIPTSNPVVESEEEYKQLQPSDSLTKKKSISLD